jgi:hypothetical protein
MTRAWGKFETMSSAPTWVRMDTIVRVAHGGGATVAVYLADGERLDVLAYDTGDSRSGHEAGKRLAQVLMRDLSATKQKALTDYTGAIK